MITRFNRFPQVLSAAAVAIASVVIGCQGGATDPQSEPAANSEKDIDEQRCVKADDCANGQVCTAQSKGECVLQGDVCTGRCEDAARATPSSAAACMKATDCSNGQVCTVQSKGACVLQGNVCTGICEPS